ncbi:nuclear transport factor 2 family protein [Streptomyces galilaeus]
MDSNVLDRLTHTEAIKQLKARYFRFTDTKQWDALGRLFTPDARLEMSGMTLTPKQFVDITGRWLAEAVTVHAGHMPEIEITGPDTATGVWTMDDLISFPDEGSGPRGMHGYGIYHEEYQLTDGQWYFSAVTLDRLRVDVSEGGLPPFPDLDA